MSRRQASQKSKVQKIKGNELKKKKKKENATGVVGGWQRKKASE